MENLTLKISPEGPDRVDGRLKVTGAAKFAVEHQIKGSVYGVLVESKIAKGEIISIDTKKAENSPGVIKVITHLNSPAIPGYQTPGTQGFKIFFDNKIYFGGQPIALVIADTFERATFAASLVDTKYSKTTPETDLEKNLSKAATPKSPRFKDYVRGEADAYKKAEVQVEEDYIMPIEVHNPMELHSITAVWDGDKLKVYDKTQGVKATQNSLVQAFKLAPENVQVIADFVGGGFGAALRTWPHEIAAVLGAKVVGRPLKLSLTRMQMFTMVGYRPYTLQRIGIGATSDGVFTGITHLATSETSTYEEFTEGTVNMTKFLYKSPNVNTSYKIVPLDISTPTWMRGPGEATGAFALESAIDELAVKLKMDPVELRLKNYTETDPERNLPYSSKFLKEAYEMGAEKIGWSKRPKEPRSLVENGLLVGYGMSGGTFSASRRDATASAAFTDDGKLLVQSAVSDSGPGTSTAMVQIAAEAFGIPPEDIVFQLGDSSLPPGPTQGGSTTTSTLGSAVHDVCVALKKKLHETEAKRSSSEFFNSRQEDLLFADGFISFKTAPSRKISYVDVLKKNGLTALAETETSRGGDEQRKYSMYSFSVHFCKVHVHPTTGVVRVVQVATVADSGKIISEKTAASQMIGGVVGGIGMALTEEGVIDHRYGRWVNNNFADYHVPVNADVPHIDTIFVNKPDPIINPMGAKGMGEIALIGFAAAVANAVYNATGKRIRELPITPDKLI